MAFITSSPFPRRDGFTLIELMITMATVGILAVVALGGWQNMKVQAMSAEAKHNLGNLRTMMELYRAEYSVFSVSTSNIGYTQPLGSRYSYSIVDASANSCTLQAEGKEGTAVIGDVWSQKIIDSIPYQPAIQP